MVIERFEDIEAWREARVLVSDIYRLTEPVRDFGFRDQIRRAAVSVMSNIAEGFERGGNREFVHFLTISRGSMAEVRSLLYAAQDIGYLQPKQHDELQQRCHAITKMLNGFIRYLKKSSRNS